MSLKQELTLIGMAALACLGIFQASPASAAVPENVAYVTNQGSGITILDTRTLKPLGSVAVGTDPRGLAVSPDGRWLLTANQGSSDVSVVDTSLSREMKRIPVGKNVEFMRISPDGSRAFVTYEPSSRGGPPGQNAADSDDAAMPAEVAVIDLKTWRVVGRMKAAPETEGIEFSADGKFVVVANEGDNTLGVYALTTLKKVRTVDLSAHGSRPRGIKLSPDGQAYVVTLENSDNFLLLGADFKVLKSVPTEKGPYGVAFDRDGSHIWVAASRADRLQVFDARSLAAVAAIPVGKRCWHFSFTPDADKVLLACGRSNALQVIDARAYRVLDTLQDYRLPWGVVTYPKAAGSLDAPMPVRQ